eukprot:3652698-Ditylum_brightwellii.AAC.1
MSLCLPHYQVSWITSKHYIDAIQSHIKIQPATSTVTCYMDAKLYRTEFITMVNNMCCNPHLQKLSNHFCFDKVGDLIRKHREKGKNDSGRGNIFFKHDKASAQCQRRQRHIYGLSVTNDRTDTIKALMPTGKRSDSLSYEDISMTRENYIVKAHGKSKEYLLLNYLIKKEYHVLSR